MLEQTPPFQLVVGGHYVDKLADSEVLMLDIIVQGGTHELLVMYEVQKGLKPTHALPLVEFNKTFDYTGVRVLNPKVGIALMKAGEEHQQYLDKLVESRLNFSQPALMHPERFFFQNEDSPVMESPYLGVRFVESDGVLNFKLTGFWCQDGLELKEIRDEMCAPVFSNVSFLGELKGWTVVRIRRNV